VRRLGRRPAPDRRANPARAELAAIRVGAPRELSPCLSLPISVQSARFSSRCCCWRTSCWSRGEAVRHRPPRSARRTFQSPELPAGLRERPWAKRDRGLRPRLVSSRRGPYLCQSLESRPSKWRGMPRNGRLRSNRAQTTGSESRSNARRPQPSRRAVTGNGRPTPARPILHPDTTATRGWYRSCGIRPKARWVHIDCRRDRGSIDPRAAGPSRTASMSDSE